MEFDISAITLKVQQEQQKIKDENRSGKAIRENNYENSILSGLNVMEPVLSFCLQTGWKIDSTRDRRAYLITYYDSESCRKELYITPFVRNTFLNCSQLVEKGELLQEQILDGKIAVFLSTTSLDRNDIAYIYAYGTAEEIIMWLADYTLLLCKFGHGSIIPPFRSKNFEELLSTELVAVQKKINQKRSEVNRELGFWKRIATSCLPKKEHIPAELEF